MQTFEHFDTIRRLNDAARQNPGLASIASVTLGFQSLAQTDRLAALTAIVRFSKFDGDNDPYGEHDFGAVYRLASGAWTQTGRAMRAPLCRPYSGRWIATTWT